MEMEIDHATLYAMLKSIGFNSFTGARDAFGLNDVYNERMSEKRIKNARKGKTHSQWIEVDESLFIKLIRQQLHYTDMASRLKIGERTLYEKSYEVFGISLSEANRIYCLYPEVEKILLNKKEIDESFLQDWVNAGLPVKEIDQEMLKLLIGLGYDKKDIESLFKWDHFRVTRWIPEILNMDFYRARDEYWWKPRIIWLFSQGYSARQMRVASKGLIGRHVTHDVIVRIWAEEYTRYGNNLNKYLYKLYGSREN
jgi:AraC-like DNA-binding protein